MKVLRIYIDASVFGGYFDAEFAQGSQRFFDGLFEGKAILLLSDTLVAELADAPKQVQDLLARAMEYDHERLGLSNEAEDLRDAYISASVLSEKMSADAVHVAHAAIARADVIVSWNFKHLVNPFRIRGFNGVNAAQGYGPVVIMTPADVWEIWRQEAEDAET